MVGMVLGSNYSWFQYTYNGWHGSRFNLQLVSGHILWLAWFQVQLTVGSRTHTMVGMVLGSTYSWFQYRYYGWHGSRFNLQLVPEHILWLAWF
jgi:hypothetical protein